MPGQKLPAMHYCGMCEQQFTSKSELNAHTQDHAANDPPKLRCPVCEWEFDDSLQLDRHQTASEHHSPRYSCENCNKGFVTQRGLENHMKPPLVCSYKTAGMSSSRRARQSLLQAAGPVPCDRCGNTFRTEQEYNTHRSYTTNGPCADHNQKHKSPSHVPGGCKDFDKPNTAMDKILEYASSSDESVAPTNMSDGEVWCGQCKKRYESQARYDLHALGCTTKHGSAGRGRGRVYAPSPVSRAISHPVSVPIPASGTPPSAAPAQVAHTSHQSPLHYAPVQIPIAPSIGHNMGDVFEREQAKDIQGKILRLLIQGDIFIHHDGKFEVGNLKFTRVPMAKQVEVGATLDTMCHLPKILQDEYLPPPKAFLSEYKAQYLASEFEPSPTRDEAKPGLVAVALVCSKVVLENGLQEVVKIAAVDVITCRILMDHLVCTNPAARVANWNTDDTGIFSWEDMEMARNQGYKIFKGWSAARAALWKFVDKNTVIVGHNLRSDLDCLRMIHGRAIDIAKVAEKAAKGPLSTKQLGLYSLCRDFPNVMLKIDGDYGCDVLLEAFAAREMGLWIIKNKDKFEKKLRQNSLAYQTVQPMAAA
ncbi:hypothetical protein DE146DRAFT_694392, partial [Phaeosphaeria sp. MPI-PUGE-AT-0046c]